MRGSLVTFLGIGVLLCCALFPLSVTAQETISTEKNIWVDFSYGLPFYIGDFNSFTSTPPPYRNREVINPVFDNPISFSGSIFFPLSKRTFIRLSADQSTFYFREDNALVFFRNSVFTLTPALHFKIIDKRFSWNIELGGGGSVSRDAILLASPNELASLSTQPLEIRPAAHIATGIQFRVWRNFHLFGEVKYLNTGSDRIDGFNGQGETVFLESEQEKAFFERDYLATVRLGVRIPLTKDTKQIEERPIPHNLSNVDVDPDFDENYWQDGNASGRLTKKQKLYLEWGIKQSLSNITLKVSFAENLDELGRQREVALRIAQQLSSNRRTFEVLILEEANGYTIHFGSFTRTSEAKQYIPRLKQHYSGVILMKNN